MTMTKITWGDSPPFEPAKDCKYFKGDEPCIFHKREGKQCTCEYYKPIDKKILIIKLGELGDVIRTTPILHRLKKDYPHSEITWITKTPEFLPAIVDYRLAWNFSNVMKVQETRYDLLLNFDKEPESCALANKIQATIKKGFKLHEGKPHPIDEDAYFKYLIGLDNTLTNVHTKSYPEQVFEIAGYEFQKEKYLFDQHYKRGKKVVGFNTGAGIRWSTRLWDEASWIELADLLMQHGYTVLLLGGESEHAKNKRIASATGALYLGHHELKTFVALISFCDLLVTTVTMALHVALALEKKVILFNNIFNPHEFELYGLGEIIQPGVPCQGCFKNECEIRFNGKTCMQLITPSFVADRVEKLLNEERTIGSGTKHLSVESTESFMKKRITPENEIEWVMQFLQEKTVPVQKAQNRSFTVLKTAPLPDEEQVKITSSMPLDLKPKD